MENRERDCPDKFGDAKIQDILLNIGIPANIYGFLYLHLHPSIPPFFLFQRLFPSR